MDDSYNSNYLRINLLDMNPDYNPSGCGYCKNIITGERNKTSYKYRLELKSLPIDVYEEMLKKGWTRCGSLFYKTSYEKTCCKLYQPRVNINNFVISNEQKRIMKRFKKFMSGEYEENKLKNLANKKEKIKIEDDYQIKITQNVKKYVDSKIYMDILNKYIKDKNIIENILKKVNETKIRRNNNKKYNFNYSCDFIFIIQNILNSNNNIKKDKNQKQNQKNIKNKININNEYKDLFDNLYINFIEYYKPIEENVLFNKETGHINFTIKNQEQYKNYIANINFLEKKDLNNINNNNYYNNTNNNIINDNINKDNKKEKYVFDYFPEIVSEPDIYYPLKYTYTIELTNNITFSGSEERALLYMKYEKVIHKEEEFLFNSNLSYNINWGKSILENNKKIPIPLNISEKTKHPEIYPKYYGTYNLIHRLNGKIIAVTVWDILPHYLVSVYCYYDPDYSFLDLGVFTTIREIEYMKSFQNLIDKNFMYYTMGEMSQTIQKLRYKGNYYPTEIMDPYSGNYILLTDEIKKLIADNKCHHLTKNDETPQMKLFSDIEIEDKYWNLMIDVFGQKVFFEDFFVCYIEDENLKNKIKMAISRFLEIIDKENYSKIEFYFDASNLN